MRALLLALLTLAPSLAAAQGACDTDLPARPVGPLQVGELDGFLAVPHRACPREEVALGGDVLLVADTADLYGNLHVNGRGRLSALLGDPRVEAFVSWEAVRYQALLSAVSSSYLGLGYLSWGASGQLEEREGRAFALTGRMVLPTTTGLDQSSQPLAMDLGVTGAFVLNENFRAHIWLTLLGSLGIGAGPADPRGGVRFGGGLDWRPFEWLSFVAEVQSGFFYRALLDVLAVNAGVRLALGPEVGVELAAALPLFGERAFDDGALPLGASLMVSWRPPGGFVAGL
ncbi:MAG: hypothetical protein H6719_07545 [Sandaracinaceae bacterium]|nr:hypothetical protein [Myxococcales bacterium]MCB9592569.1 hypothetical protein [Sandaracinaceae bacterium]